MWDNLIKNRNQVVTLCNHARNAKGSQAAERTRAIAKLRTSLRGFQRYLTDLLSKWFPKSGPYGDEQLAEEIFRIRNDEPNRRWVEMNTTALVRTTRRLWEAIERLEPESRDWPQKEETHQLWKDHIVLLEQVVWDSLWVLDVGFESSEGRDNQIASSWWESEMAHHPEVVSGALRYLGEDIYPWSSKTIPMPSMLTFMIRQAIEVRLRHAFGIASITNQKGRRVAVQLRIFLDVLRTVLNERDDVIWPVGEPLLRLINNWTNVCIHGGAVPPAWQVEWALHIIRPLFAGGERDDIWQPYGAVQIPRSVYNAIPEKIVDRLPKKERRNGPIRIERRSRLEAIVFDG